MLLSGFSGTVYIKTAAAGSVMKFEPIDSGHLWEDFQNTVCEYSHTALTSVIKKENRTRHIHKRDSRRTTTRLWLGNMFLFK